MRYRDSVLGVMVGFGLTVGGVAMTASPVAAQSSAVECRCVDGSGDRIEDCLCLATPAIEGAFAPLPFTRRSVLGVVIDFTQSAEADAIGAELQDVSADGPAERAGLRAGDRVVRVDGHSVFDALDPAEERRLTESQSLPVQRFVQRVGALEPGDAVEIEYVRSGATRTATVTPDEPEDSRFGSFEERFPLQIFSDEMGSFEGQGWSADGPGVFRFEGPARADETRVGSSFPAFFRADPCVDLTRRDGRMEVRVLGMENCVDGVEFVDLNEGLGEYFGTDRGVLVAEVAPESSLGLRPGDVLMAIDGREVESVEQARRVLGSYTADEELRLRVMRRGEETEILARMR